MKLLFSIHRLAGLSGGAERVFCDICNGLSDAGHEIEVVTFDPIDGAPFYDLRVTKIINLMQKKNAPNVPNSSQRQRIKANLRRIAIAIYYRLPSNAYVDKTKWNMAYEPLIRAAKDFVGTNRFDAVVAFLPPAFTIWGEVLKDRDERLVLSTHNVPEQDFENPRRWDSNPLAIRKRKEAAIRADEIIVLREQFKSYFETLRQSEEHIHVIPNMLVLPEEAPMKKDRAQTVIAVGRLARVKRYDKLIEIWDGIAENFPGWKLKIFGAGGLRDKLASDIKERGLENSVELCGVTKQIYNEYQDAMIFAHTAEFEGFGMSVAEALACQLPVVAFRDTDAMADLIQDGENGFLAKDEEHFKSRLSELMRDQNLRSQMAKAAEASIEPYKPEHVLALWEDVLKP